MLFTEKTLVMLEYDKIKEMLADCSFTAGAKSLALRLQPTGIERQVIYKQKATFDARRLAEAKGFPSFGGIVDVTSLLDKAKRGGMLIPAELLRIADLLRVTRGLHDYIREDKPFDTVLDESFSLLTPNRHLEEQITRAILSEDSIADEASPTLADLRRKIRGANDKIKETLQKFISGSYGKLLQENIVTMRNDRYVVPVKIEHRAEIRRRPVKLSLLSRCRSSKPTMSSKCSATKKRRRSKRSCTVFPRWSALPPTFWRQTIV